MGLALVLSGALGWLLARLVWLPFYFGLFFYLVAGLLVGALSFRLARPARPVSSPRLIAGIVLAALGSSVITTVWEYRNFARTVGGEHEFPDARNAAVADGRPARDVEARATDAFREALKAEYPPGGPIGYIRWAVSRGEMQLTVDGYSDHISVAHRGWAWPVRTAVGMLLVGVGLWLAFESLRSPVPVSNILAPGEEAEEEDED